MDEKKKKELELKFFKETELKLKASSPSHVISTLKELHKTGNVSILPLILDLLETTEHESIAKEVLILLGELKDNKTVPMVAAYIDKHPKGKYLSKVIAACWQSGLDFSSETHVFINSFITGNYEVALESFTVVEEMIWRITTEKINEYKDILIGRGKEITEEKKPLYQELIKILDEGITQNRDEYPDLYLQ